MRQTSRFWKTSPMHSQHLALMALLTLVPNQLFDIMLKIFLR